ncbi:single-stranded-DNA-specific exonuclease RecJ [Isoalcanivorax beigongshangi]|uniref:Single-stranded-DNA-specific exonuclease RecJ n=1 Tax=Isoalcanivorax beigongshangi TaxID=3238810 RepID=A0ABV4AG53_9GAMM
MSLPQIRRRPVPDVVLPSVPPLLARILAARGVSSESELDLSLQQLPAPDCLPGLDAAVALLLQARAQQWTVLIVGDYDADGATATALLWRGLQWLGLAQPQFLVPDRFIYGYGLSEAIVELACQQGTPDLIITVDNGIASIDGVAAARAAGIRVLITDHHLPGEALPEADAIVNPRLVTDHPLANLAGVGVAFYVLMALRAALREQGQPAAAPLAELLDLVAVGTVADVVPLCAVNRALVEQGLRRIRAGRACAGVRALLQVSGREPALLTATDLGFVVGPRINAAGRLADMRLGIACLLADDDVEALAHAGELDRINRERRVIEQGMRDAAEQQVAQLTERGAAAPLGVCLYDPHWHEGVVGLLASRVKERLHRPVVALAPAQQPGMLKGSGRSIPGLHLRDVLDRVATRHPGLLHRFGGHAMAAGLTMAEADLPAFTAAFSDAVAELALPGCFDPVLDSDGPLAATDVTLSVAELLQRAYPWGQGFAPPLFDGEFEVLNARVVGERHLKLTLGLPDTGAVVDAIHFGADEALLAQQPTRVQGLYRLEVNQWQGRRSVQLVFQHLIGH